MNNFDHKEFSKKGGDTTKELHPDHLPTIASRGGEAVKQKYGADYYKELNRKSQEAKKAKKKIKAVEVQEKPKQSALTKLTNLITGNR